MANRLIHIYLITLIVVGEEYKLWSSLCSFFVVLLVSLSYIQKFSKQDNWLSKKVGYSGSASGCTCFESRQKHRITW
jgi:hypothetical protein